MDCSSRVAGLQYPTPVGWMEHLEVSPLNLWLDLTTFVEMERQATRWSLIDIALLDKVSAPKVRRMKQFTLRSKLLRM